MTSTVLWLQRDLRTADHPALCAAVARGLPVVPLFILDDEDAGPWAEGGASRWWLHGSLTRLGERLRALGSPLVLRRGPAPAILAEVLGQTGASALYWSRRHEPWALRREPGIFALARSLGCEARAFPGALLRDPAELRNRAGEPYRVFTPFWKALRAAGPMPGPMRAPDRLRAPASPVPGEDLDSWSLLPRSPDWASAMRAQWQPGEAGARERLAAFLEEAVFEYDMRRDHPALPGTSRLSPHLAFGEIGPRAAWVAAMATHARGEEPTPRGVEAFVREIAWREFCAHLLHHVPSLVESPLRPEFERFPWIEDAAGLRAWQRGATGFPIVDAGMRELWTTGWMHNRVRMIVASILVKDLLVHWRRGEAWFRDTLVDADLASNVANWQWVAGSGADAAPFFRIFNPVLQGRRFDPGGEYVRRWVPELAGLPADLVHAPWEARPVELAAAGITPGRTYPEPIVDHHLARERALAAFRDIRA